MVKLLQKVWGDRSLATVAGIFCRQAEAEAAMEQLRNEIGLGREQVRLLRPEDAEASHGDLFGLAVERVPAGLARRLVQTHLGGGLAGAALGLALFMWLATAGSPMVVSSPVPSFVAIVGFGITFGLLVAGMIALRPDRIMLIEELRSAMHDNRWVVVARPADSGETAKIKSVLEARTAQVRSTV